MKITIYGWSTSQAEDAKVNGSERISGLCRAKLAHGSELVFLCPSGWSPVLIDQAVDNLSAFDPRGNVDPLAGLVQRRSLSARLERRCSL